MVDNEVEEFEKSLEKFEDEFKENQNALKSLHKKITSTGKSNKNLSAKKVSDFFKPRDSSSSLKTDQKVLSVVVKKEIIPLKTSEENNNNKFTGNKLEKTNESSELTGKRPNPFLE